MHKVWQGLLWALAAGLVCQRPVKALQLPTPAARGRCGHRHSAARMQFGDLFKGMKIDGLKPLEEAAKGLTGEQQDDGETAEEAATREERRRKLQEAAAEEEEDLPTKLFRFFIGDPSQVADDGIARTSAAPDTYPATKTEFAEPVDGDTPDVAHLRPLLKNTNLELLNLRLAYDADVDGWTAEDFHRLVDKQGPCLVAATTEGGCVCGGYAPKGFAGYGEYRGSIAAFLYTWPDGDVTAPVVKLQKLGGAGLATIDEPETGPRFGMDGFTVPMTPGFERMAKSKLGPFYELMPGTGSTKERRSIFAPSDNPMGCKLTSLKVYVGVWPEGERIPFDGAIPFAIE